MGVIIRGFKNAFRNWIRSLSIVALLGISCALALALLLANQAVKTKITDLKASAATTLTVSPAGMFGREGGGEPLTRDDVKKLEGLENIAQVGAHMLAFGRQMLTGSSLSQSAQPEPDVELDSSIDPGTLGKRGAGVGASNVNFKLPVMMTGLLGQLDRTGTQLKLTGGTLSFSGDDVYEAVLGKGIAAKNNLSVGSTFKAYKQTFKVVGIIEGGTEFANDAVYGPISTMQRLTGQPSEVNQIFVRVNAIDNLDSVKTAIGNALGNTRVDITTPAQNTFDTITAMKGIQQISVTGMVVALGAAAVITFLVMVMIVRERRREIGVLKAIGASNVRVVGQFVTEALVLTLCGAVLGVALAAASSNQITGALVKANVSESIDHGERGLRAPGGGTGRPGFVMKLDGSVGTARSLVRNIETSIGWPLLAQGLGMAVLIAVLGSAIPAWLIAKVQPAEVMRAE